MYLLVDPHDGCIVDVPAAGSGTGMYSARARWSAIGLGRARRRFARLDSLLRLSPPLSRHWPQCAHSTTCAKGRQLLEASQLVS